MKKRNLFLVLLLIVTLVAGTAVTAYAEATAAEKQQEANEAEEKADEAAEKAEEANEKAEDLEVKFYQLQEKIEKQQAKIEKTKKKIKKKQKEIKTQTEALNDRLTAMYKTGSIGFVDVILNSEGVEDLFSNMGMVQKILKSDQDLLKKLEKDLKEVKRLKEKQETQEAELQADQNEIEATRQEYIALAEKYEEDEEKLRAEAEKLAKEAEELARKAAEQQGGAFIPTPNGQYAWPTDSNYIFTSYYGWRIHPIFGYRKYHSGYDICLTNGTYGKPVYSVGDGVVSMASYYGGYGNCVMVNIGNGYTTLYGHLSGYAVSEGQKVTRGQVVGYIGSTGWSTGPHLHFSLMYNGELVDPMILY